ncbi:uncharacterized protein CYBJADRAFT_38047 [Cyberlindnera jadinii NRRL Y-1542]|uniref:Uncharacterized protein n=1 Tax=Cyberlindnera jadinii (strain ATCC 18201 / CBS 1600 / BCRC 20928 / JCM 3617 / NBRC 0987 / NRRL Y-1542) TaxID=983966 RepID=A0A1E4RVD5_CYBJN|nr:hypothetical protein CYBJADRAFT_38047 [Cyberlindnera jadinii NRRL Y-1542]ODV71243.1 hypothetical protein CYBJADRAFT_38047 [Cyberlindnera jadinii NRRL Y-1542]
MMTSYTKKQAIQKNKPYTTSETHIQRKHIQRKHIQRKHNTKAWFSLPLDTNTLQHFALSNVVTTFHQLCLNHTALAAFPAAFRCVCVCVCFLAGNVCARSPSKGSVRLNFLGLP